jgi:hypothetical protein
MRDIFEWEIVIFQCLFHEEVGQQRDCVVTHSSAVNLALADTLSCTSPL